ncbi:hypothetical protein ACQ4PT_050150 [Festuca glaucescens]
MDLDKMTDDVAANGQDIEQARRGQELPPSGGHGTNRLAIGNLIRELVLEGVATFLVVFWSCTAAVMQETRHALSFPTVCLVVALTVAFVLGWMGPAHLNPAVTVTFAAFRYFPWRKLPLYAAAQLGASVLACLSVNGVMRTREEHFYGTNKAVGGMAIGAAVGTLGLVIGPVSGGSMNPVRSLGPAIVFGRYTDIWIYVVAPVAGMMLGALFNKAVRQSDAIVGFLCGGRGTSSRVVVIARPVGGAAGSN